MRGRPTKDPYTRSAINTLERLHAELGGKILENRQEAESLREQMQHVSVEAATVRANRLAVGIGPTEWAERAAAFLKHKLKETEASITNKLARGTFPATFFLACIAALELDGVALEEI